MQPGDPIWIFHGVEIVKRVTVADIADSLAAIVAILAFLLGVRRFSKTISDGTEAIRQGNAALQSNHYSELDHFYADILKIGIDKPHLRSPKPIASDEEAMFGDYRPYAPEKDDDGTMAEQYDAYAFLVWNFLETIHDRCHEDESLRGTWKPVIAAENRIHRGWFLAEMRNEYKRRSSAKDQPRRRSSVRNSGPGFISGGGTKRTGATKPPPNARPISLRLSKGRATRRLSTNCRAH